MILELSIKDFAIIDSLRLSLDRKFNVFTGETGAGKSIIIDAVNALLGGKIGAEFVRAGCERASVEGVFSLEALAPVRDRHKQVEALAPVGGGTTLFEAAEANAAPNTSGDDPDVQSANARVALTALLREYDIEPEDGQLILSRDIFRSGRTVARINGRAYSQQ